MTERLNQILERFHHYNMQHMAARTFGLSEDEEYDALVIAPSFTPQKLAMEETWRITETEARGYCAGYVVEKDGLKIAWIRTTTGACNLVDYLLLCAELKFRKLIFIGAAGALKAELDIGDVCIPSYSIAGTLANTYLKKSLHDYVPFEKVQPHDAFTDKVIALAKEHGHTVRKASVFCTDSIAMEYTHLDEIRAFGTDLIEMETSAFYAVAEMMEVPAAALLVVSDNSATGVPLVGRSDEEQNKYHYARKTVFPEMIALIAQMKNEQEVKNMTKLDYKAYFNHLFPGFFERPYICKRPKEYISEELIMDLHSFNASAYPLTCPDNITFGMYDGDMETLRAAVNEVDETWTQYFTPGSRIYCAFDAGKVVSFCLVDDFGVYNGLKVGGPGCVGTVPAYRKQGIGLKMVLNATEMLKQDGYDISHIHYTAVGPWYAHIGYQVVLQWNADGFIG